MADIRLSRPRTSRLWLWIGLLSLVGLLLWGSAFVVGDATAPSEGERRGVGANAGFGEERAPLIPMPAEPLTSLKPLQTRDLGRFVRVRGTAETGVRAHAMWTRTEDGRRILVRFEPPPDSGALERFGPGRRIELDGYISKISQAEFEVWMDTLRVSIPRPPPGRKFGDLPDPAFARVDSLFIKNFYISVRPEALAAPETETASAQ